MEQITERLPRLTIDHFVIGLAAAFVRRGASAIVPPQIDRRSDYAAVRTAHEIQRLYDGSKYDVRFYMALKHAESQTWREGLGSYGESMFRPVEEHGLLYLQPDVIMKNVKEVPGEDEMWYELSHLYTTTFQETSPMLTGIAQYYGFIPSSNGIHVV